jgi:D-xylonolactonase
VQVRTIGATPSVFVDSRCILGEGPLWHPDERRIYWLDIARQLIFRCCVDSERVDEIATGGVVGGATLQADGSLLLMGARGALRVLRDTSVTELLAPSRRLRGYRFNDSIADPLGAVFAGIMAVREVPSSRFDILGRVRSRLERAGFLGRADERPGALFRIDSSGVRATVLATSGRPNGMGFSPDGRSFYFTDSLAKCIYAFDFDPASGRVARQRTFVDARAELGTPDGLVVDAEGGVWSAQWNGGCVIRYSDDGVEERRVHFPARLVTSLAFGGDDLDTAFVTTAGGTDRAQNGSGAGALFRFDPGVVGVPEHRSDVMVAPRQQPGSDYDAYDSCEEANPCNNSRPFRRKA